MDYESARVVLAAVQDFDISISRAIECLEGIEAGTYTDDWLPERKDLFGLDDIPVDLYVAQQAEINRLRTIEDAAKNLVAVKGRYHSEQAYQRLVDAVKGEI